MYLLDTIYAGIVFVLYAHEEPRESKPCSNQPWNRRNCSKARWRSKKKKESSNSDDRVRSKAITRLYYAAIVVSPTIDEHNFELRPALISSVEKDQFDGHSSENPNMHLHNFIAKCDIIKLNKVPTNAIWARLFPFSLRDGASDWLQNEEPNSFTTGEALSKAFLSKHFPLGKTAKLRMNITSLAQRDGEFLYEAWERFKDL